MPSVGEVAVGAVTAEARGRDSVGADGAAARGAVTTVGRRTGRCAAGAEEGAAGAGEALLQANAEMATKTPKIDATYRFLLIFI